MKGLLISIAVVLLVAAGIFYWQQNTSDSEDYLWLEEVMGEKALTWVRQRNTTTLEELTRFKDYKQLKDEALGILNAKDKLTYGKIRGAYVYNLWQDAQHVRGLWRRMPWQDYIKNKDEWELVLDLDKLAKDEGKSWVMKGASCLKPDYERCILRLSDGGKDASHLREFDIKSKSFVSDGFNLPESKSSASWLDKDTLIVNSALDSQEQTDSGYPKIAKIWRRGTKISEAQTIFTGEQGDVSAGAFVQEVEDKDEIFFYRSKTFYTSSYALKLGDKTQDLPIPEDAEFEGVIGKHLLLALRSPQLGYQKGDLISLDFDALKTGKQESQLVFRPSSTQAVADVKSSKDFLFVTILDDVYSKLLRFTIDNKGGWQKQDLPLPGKGTLSLFSVDKDSPKILANYEDHLTPPSLLALDPKTMSFATIQTLPPRFSSEGMEVNQFKAKSKDGTMIPYFIIHKKDLVLNGSHPTLLYGYGGFEVSLRPNYSSLTGKLWLERGGVYVVANIRGGGEYGPRWHQAALKQQRHKAYEDFIAVAEDLIQRGISSPEHLGISGGSNGGLLVGAVFTQRPELFNAVVCAVPLLDMLRFHQLLAGASWMGEYGDPEVPEEAQYLRSYSPFHVVKKDQSYPEVFFVTSTKDDRVHPGHARKMVKKMDDLGHKVYYFENIEGGHSAAANLVQVAERYALQYSYLFQKLR